MNRCPYRLIPGAVCVAVSETDERIAEMRKKLDTINAEWSARSLECRHCLDAMALLDVESAEYGVLLDRLGDLQAQRSRLGDLHTQAMTEWMDAVLARLKSIREVVAVC